jgi:hypothetical protein
LANDKNHPLAPHHAKKKISFAGRGRRSFCKFFFQEIYNAKGEETREIEAEKRRQQLMAPDEPSSECKKFLVGLVARFYEAESNMALEMKYIRYEEESISKFNTEMKQRMMEALYNPVWMDETLKSGYENFFEKMTHDSIWNAKNILIKYGKTHQARDTAFKEAILRIELFAESLGPFTKSHNQAGSVDWWETQVGMAKEASQRRHLVALSNTARVIATDNHHRRGGYATIKRVRM